MKLREFLPDIANRDAQLIKANEHLINNVYVQGFESFAKSKRVIESQVEPLGIEQLYFEWLRTAYAYRRQFIQDLYLLAFDSVEVRSIFMQIKNEIFRKGFEDWKPKFIKKCNDCGREFQRDTDSCDACGSISLRKPDPKQCEKFDDYRLKCNVFGQTLEDIFKTISDDLGIVDDGFILIQKKYLMNKSTNQMYSKVEEIRRIHPALIEFDLDKSGVPKNSHWICLFHRDNIDVKEGICLICGNEMVPAMYVYNHRGRRIYVPEDEMIHVSKFSPSEVYGYCYDEKTDILTKNGFKSVSLLDYNDEIATLGKGNCLEYQKPIALIKKQHNGKLIHISNSQLDICVTPEHRLYIDKGNGFEKVSAASVVGTENKISFTKWANWEGKDKEFFELPEFDWNWNRVNKSKPVEMSRENWAKLLGFYTAHGSGKVIYDSLGDVSKFLSESGIDYSYRTNRKGLVCNLSNQRVIDSLVGTVGSSVRNRTLDSLIDETDIFKNVFGNTVASTTGAKYGKTIGYGIVDKMMAVINIHNNIANDVLSDKIMIGSEGIMSKKRLKKHYPSINIPMDIWCEFLGYYLSEGDCEKNGAGINVSQMTYSPYYSDIESCLNKTPWKWKKTSKGFETWDRQLWNYLSKFGKSGDKYIPLDIKELSSKYLSKLFYALMAGDGSRNTYYYTKSPKLRDDVQEIVLKIGLSSNIGRYRNGVYELIVQKGWAKEPYAVANDITEEDFNGYVYCCQVPNDVIFTRRSGKTVWNCNSPLLTAMQKVLTLNGMDRFLYRYFFERKTPTGMIVTYTDDPQSLEVERQRIESRMMEDPTYVPWIGVSAKTGRGRSDFIRLFHTLQEMDYLPVRNEIRDRLSAIYGVPQLYMNVIEGAGGISGSSQQMKMFSNVIQSDQRIYNEKIFPKILKAFGITDWKLELRPPEEKVEGQILTLAQQKVAIAQAMVGMGFNAQLKEGSKDFDTIDFVFSGKAMTIREQQQKAEEMQAAASTPVPDEGQGDTGATNLPKGAVQGRNEPNEREVYRDHEMEEPIEDSKEEPGAEDQTFANR